MSGMGVRRLIRSFRTPTPIAYEWSSRTAAVRNWAAGLRANATSRRISGAPSALSRRRLPGSSSRPTPTIRAKASSPISATLNSERAGLPEQLGDALRHQQVALRVRVHLVGFQAAVLEDLSQDVAFVGNAEFLCNIAVE